MHNFLPLRLSLALLVLACTGCSSQFLKDPGNAFKNLTMSPSEKELAVGMKNYEDGDYKTAAKQLQNSLDLGLDSKNDQGQAHKYLAFISCASNHEKICREEFRKAFESDPKFDLQPAEAGHPIWGPVFRSVKTEIIGKAKSK